MGEFAKYPHLEALYRVPELRHFRTVIATEKIHGTNARIGWIDGTLRVGGRNEELTETNTNFGLYNWVMANKDAWIERLRETFDAANAVVYGEWYGPKIQKGVNYGAEKQFRAFDVRVNDVLLDWDDYQAVCVRLNVSMAPLVYQGPYDENAFLDLRHRISVVGQLAGVDDPENTWEGIVVRPPIMVRSKRGEWVMAKFKDEAFEERKSLKKTPLSPVDTAEADAFAAEWVTPMRLEHVLQQAREQGVAGDSMRDMGHVLRLMAEDVRRESGTADDLWQQVHKAVARDTKERFQERLLAEVSA